MLQLPIRVKGVVHDGDTPDFQNGVVSHNTWDDVGKQDGHAVPFLDAEVCQAGRKTVHHLLELPVRHVIPLKKKRHCVGESLGRTVQEFRKACFLVSYSFRNTFIIMGQPWFVLISV